MHSGRYVFSQVVDFVPGYEIDRIVAKHNGNYHARGASDIVRSRRPIIIKGLINLMTLLLRKTTPKYSNISLLLFILATATNDFAFHHPVIFS